jgi:hypothetical protein
MDVDGIIVELEDTSRSCGFTCGYRDIPEEEAKGEAEQWKNCEDEGGDRARIKSVSSTSYSNDFLRLSTSSTTMEKAAEVANRELRSPLALSSLENGVKVLAFFI